MLKYKTNKGEDKDGYGFVECGRKSYEYTYYLLDQQHLAQYPSNATGYVYYWCFDYEVDEEHLLGLADGYAMTVEECKACIADAYKHRKALYNEMKQWA